MVLRTRKACIWPLSATIAILTWSCCSLAAPPAPPTDVVARDKPNDGGESILVTWEKSVDDGGGLNNVTGYQILRSPSEAGRFEPVGTVPAGRTGFADVTTTEAGEVTSLVEDNSPYYYVVRAQAGDEYAGSTVAGPAVSKRQWFHRGRLPVFVCMMLFGLLIAYYVAVARKRAEDIFVRPIAGLDAIDEAVGRATEMGRPILYLFGLGTAATISTIASYAIISRITKKVAEYQTRLIVPCYDPIVMAIAQETVRAAYLDAGRPDLYDDKDVFFVTHAQFAYVAAVNGIMVREKTAANFYMGKFYAESLILAETGAMTGSIQIAGTDEPSQLPFFVTACDYTLIGEELYAASAYLGREPLLLGALKAQDIVKGIGMVLLVVGAILMSFNIDWVRVIVRVTE